MSTLAIADSPYLKCCKLYGHFHNPGGTRSFDGRCWDDLETHRRLIVWLSATFDGWALCLSARSLRAIPGSGAVGRAWDAYSDGRLELTTGPAS